MAEIIGLEFGLGTLLTLLTFLRSEVGGRHTKEDLLRKMDEAGKVQQFREWLRGQDHQDLIGRIELSKTELLSELSQIGDRLERFATEVLKVSGDIGNQLRALNSRIRAPVLSSRSLPTRPRANIVIKGRERELKWLIDGIGDALISGQPGSGKTELLQTFASEYPARFLVTDSQNDAIEAILASCPPILVVDDAGTKHDLITRLRHLRIDRELDFRLVAICWPFDKIRLQQVLQISPAATLDLDGLPRPTIAEIIKEIAAKRGVEVNDPFIRVIAKQARGMPGLAASLSLATIDSGGNALLSGDLLLNDLAPLLFRVAGSETVHLLSAFACGGSKGISFSEVARNLQKGILQVKLDSERVALAGVLEQTGKDTLCVQPEFLRSALLKETFFRTEGLSLPWDVCEALIASAADPVLGYLEIIHARGRAGASVSIQLLRNIAVEVNDSRIWDAMAALDAENCEWVVNFTSTLSAEIKRAGLHYIPLRIIPILLSTAVGEKRPLNAFPDADLRLIEEWVSSAWAEAFDRRKKLFEATISWLKAGGALGVVFSAIRIAFGLNYHETDSDPSDPRTIRWRDALLPLETARSIFAQWPILLCELRAINSLSWPGLVQIIDNWHHSGPRMGNRIPDGYGSFLDSSTVQMLQELLPLASENQAALRWVYLRLKSLGIVITPCPARQEFMALFPEESLDNWEEADRAHVAAARELAVKWSIRPTEDVIKDLIKWEGQAESFGRIWPQMTPVFSARLAEMKEFASSELDFAIHGLSARTIAPILEAAIATGRMTPTHFNKALDRPDLHGFLTQSTLSGKTPELYERLQLNFPQWEPLVESLCHRGEVADEVLKRLLEHIDEHLRSEVALYTFRSERGVPAPLHNLWRNVIIETLVKLAGSHDGNQPRDLDAILKFDPTIGPAVLNRILHPESEMHSIFADGLMSSLISALGKEERRALLHRCSDLVYSPLPHLLVGRDEDLFNELLKIPGLKGFYQNVLVGDPNIGDWSALAKIALSAGYSHRDISQAVNSHSYTWNGNLSNYFQEWVERFQKLSSSADPEIRRIAMEGLDWSSAQRDAQRKSEKRQEIHGFD